MNQNRKKSGNSHRPLALLLSICLLASTLAPRAGAASTVTAADAGELKDQVEALNATGGGTINLTGDDYLLASPLTITSRITIQGSGATIRAMKNSDVFTTGTQDLTKNLYNGLIQLSGEQARVTMEGVTLDPASVCRAVRMEGGSELTLRGCTVKNGLLTNSEQGAGIFVGPICTLNAAIEEGDAQVAFVGNRGDTGSATGGGATLTEEREGTK